MKKQKKNDSYGCGTWIAIAVILGAIAEFLPVAAGWGAIALIAYGIYKYNTDKKNQDLNTEHDLEQKLNTYSMTGDNHTENELKETIQRKNKLISEQNFDISEKDRKIADLEKNLDEQKEKYQKLFLERNELLLRQSEYNSESKTKKEYIKIDDLDPYTWETALFLSEKETCNIELVKKRFQIRYERCERIINELYEMGIVGEDENGYRKVLIDNYSITKIYSDLIGNKIEKKSKNQNDAITKKLNAKIEELENTIVIKNKRIHEVESVIDGFKVEIGELQKVCVHHREEVNRLRKADEEKTKSFLELGQERENELNKFKVMLNNLKNEIGEIDGRYTERELRLEQEFQEKRNKMESEIKDIKKELETLNNEAIEEYYVFSDYRGITSQDCQNQLFILKTKENDIRKSGEDVFVFDYSEKKKIVERSIRQILRNFNADCDNIIMNISSKNIDLVRNRIIKSYETLNNMYEKDGVSLTDDILSLKLEQATLLYTYEMKRIEEKQIQQAIKEQNQRQPVITVTLSQTCRNVLLYHPLSYSAPHSPVLKAESAVVLFWESRFSLA